MIPLLIAFISSFIANYLLIRYKHLHANYSSDWDTAGPQKFHSKIVPRIGGIGIFFGLFFAILIPQTITTSEIRINLFLLCVIPVFFIGLSEDLTKKISINLRLFFTAASAIISIALIPLQITRFDLPILDLLFNIPFFGIIFTLFAITGLVNSFNIIDGLNGLASMSAIITLTAISYVSHQFDDQFVLYASLIMIGAIAGFFILNYPAGLIFLGDGGAYLIGFWIAILSIALTYKHQEISPWFAIAVNAYPITETIFTIYRRKIHQKKNMGHPDGIHLHTLVYRRLLNRANMSYKNVFINANSKTSIYLWIFTSFPVFFGAIFWQSTAFLLMTILCFLVCYVYLYTKIVSFNTPKWIKIFTL
jgi:UDP-N-acetylmuramyl pentapeptide phosphotransferase/UDP-N-acetylglucosamine-1-phosphate transferase